MTGATPNPYDHEDTCRCSAWSESECGCGGYVDMGKLRAWQAGYDAAVCDLTPKGADIRPPGQVVDNSPYDWPEVTPEQLAAADELTRMAHEDGLL